MVYFAETTKLALSGLINSTVTKLRINFNNCWKFHCQAYYGLKCVLTVVKRLFVKQPWIASGLDRTSTL